MKKIKITLVLILLIILQGCAFEDPKYIHFKDKSSNDFYTKEIYSKLLKSENYSLDVFNTNIYKNIPVADEEENVIENFIRELSPENYLEDTEISNKEPYQIKIKFEDNSSYVIKVYNENTISVSPWDGIFKEDIINIENLPKKYNLYDFCKHIENKAREYK
ncbi:DUF4883 family protein [Clostridium paraputrificum]|uniref:DUF4883 family protein n=1 Tax=Clostridium TaxID=1485 RepID=UPI003D33122B